MKPNPKSKQNYSDIVLDYSAPTNESNKTNCLIGFVFLVLNKIRHELQGLKSAGGFSSSLFEKEVSNNLWYLRHQTLKYLMKYFFQRKNINTTQ